MWATILLALTTGVVAAFNPCGFAMLPAYLGFFVGQGADDQNSNAARSVLRGLVVGLSVTMGFVAVFGSIGFLTQQFEERISLGDFSRHTPKITVVAGIVMVIVGLAMLRGWEPKLNLPRLSKGGKSDGIGSMFMFGVSYAIVSLSCTAPIFLSTVIGSFGREGRATGIFALLAYAGGMGMVIITLTMAAALARNEVATTFRKALPYVNKVSGGLVFLVGIFLAFYGWWEVQTFSEDGVPEKNWVVIQGEKLQASIVNWLGDVEGGRLSVVLLLAILTGLLFLLRRRISSLEFGAGLGVLGLAWLAGELFSMHLGRGINGRFEMFTLPMARTIVALPGRLANWFTDPIRWATLGEVLFVLLVAGIAWVIKVRRRRQQEVPNEPEATPVSPAPVST